MSAEMRTLFAASQELLDRLPSAASDHLLSPIASSDSVIASEMRRLLSPQSRNAAAAGASAETKRQAKTSLGFGVWGLGVWV